MSNDTATPVASGGATESFGPTVSGILKSLLQADFAALMHNRRSLILAIVMPLLVLVAWKKVFLSSDALLAASITIGVMSMAILGYSMSTARDREKGIFQRLRTTPAPTWAIMVSRLGVQLAACLTMAVLALVIGYAVDNISLMPVGYALTLAVTIIGAAMFLSIGQALVGLVRSADTVNAVGRIIYIGLFLVGLLGSSDRLGTGFDTAATWSPYGTISSLLSGAMDTSTWDGHTWLALAVSAAYIFLFAGVGIRWFRWSSEG